MHAHLHVLRPLTRVLGFPGIPINTPGIFGIKEPCISPKEPCISPKGLGTLCSALIRTSNKWVLRYM